MYLYAGPGWRHWHLPGCAGPAPRYVNAELGRTRLGWAQVAEVGCAIGLDRLAEDDPGLMVQRWWDTSRESQ